MLHIGQRLKEVAAERGLTSRDIAEAVPCDRSNIYDIFHRESISVQLLVRLCEILKHDFFAELSEDLKEKRKVLPPPMNLL